MIEYFVTDLKRRLAQQIEADAISIGYGSCGSHEEYLKRVGRVAGLRDALKFIEASAKRYDAEEENW